MAHGHGVSFANYLLCVCVFRFILFPSSRSREVVGWHEWWIEHNNFCTRFAVCTYTSNSHIILPQSHWIVNRCLQTHSTTASSSSTVRRPQSVIKVRLRCRAREQWTFVFSSLPYVHYYAHRHINLFVNFFFFFHFFFTSFCFCFT